MRMRRLSFLAPATGSLVGLLALLTIPSRTASDRGSWQSPVTSGFTCTPTIQWFWDGLTRDPGHPDVMGQVVVVNLTDDNGDGVIDARDNPEVAFLHFNSSVDKTASLTVVNGADGSPFWTMDSVRLALTPLAAGDLTGDGVAELIATTYDGRVPATAQKIVAFDRDGNKVVDGALYDQLRSPPYFTISLANLDTVGPPEILVGDLVFDENGVLLSEGNRGEGRINAGKSSTGVDLDLDCDLELLAGKTAYQYANNGLTEWWTFGGAAGQDGGSAVGNFMNDDHPEIVFVTKDPPTIRLLDHQGNLIGSPLVFGSFSYAVFPAIGQFDNDDFPEVALTNTDSLFRLDFDPNTGLWSITWSMDVNDLTTGSGLSLADLDGDGIDEVIYRDQDTLWIVDGETREVEFQYPVISWTGVEYPVAADIDGDDRMEVVVTSSRLPSHPAPGIGVYAFKCETWADGRRAWNDYTYHITNINEDGTVPRIQERSWLNYNSFLAQDALGVVQSGPWTIEIVDPEVVGDYNALDLHLNRPWVSYYDEVNGDLKIGVKDDPYCGPGWVLIPQDFIGNVGRWTSIAIDSAWGNGIGMAHISYHGLTDGSVKYADLRECQPLIMPVKVDNGGDLGTDIAVSPGDPFGDPCIVYYDAANGDLKYAEMDFPSGQWTTVTVDAGGPTNGNVGKYPAIAIDPTTGRRHVSYYDATNGNLKYASCIANCGTPAGWAGSIQVVDEGNPTTNRVGLFTQIAVDQYHTPHISYIDSTNQDLKYAWRHPLLPVWLKGVVEDLTNVFASTSIDIDKNFIPPGVHISYSNRTTKTLKCAKCTAGNCHLTANWVIETVPDPWDDVGLWNSIAVGLADTVHISYSAALCSFKALKYAKGNP